MVDFVKWADSEFEKMSGLPGKIIEESQHWLVELVPGIKAEPDKSNTHYFHVVTAGFQYSNFEGGTLIVPSRRIPKGST